MSSNNGLRPAASLILNQLEQLGEKMKNTKAEQLHVSCVNCDNWHEAEEYCRKYRERPPARIIAFGCGDWSNIEDDIPF